MEQTPWVFLGLVRLNRLCVRVFLREDGLRVVHARSEFHGVWKDVKGASRRNMKMKPFFIRSGFFG